MTTPTTPDRGGRPLSLSRLARKAMRADGPKWFEILRRDAAMGDSVAIQALLALAAQQPPNKPT